MTHLHILYPSEPFNLKEVSETYAQEYEIAHQQFSCSLIDLDGNPNGKLNVPDNCKVLYRGWMLTANQYEDLLRKVETPVTSLSAYLSTHHLPNWYDQCLELTPKTVFLENEEGVDEAVAQLDWAGYFVKDFVKSLTTSRGSFAKDAKEIKEVLHLIRQYRGFLEGGICLREQEAFEPGTEERVFVVKGKPYGREGVVLGAWGPALKMPSDFYSMDIVKNTQGEWRLVELGDGQVSDYKNWDPHRFVELFSYLA